MLLRSIGVLINKREFWRYLLAESYKKSNSTSLMFSNNKAIICIEQVQFVNAMESNFRMLFINVFLLPYKI